jgi:hypothetical protein
MRRILLSAILAVRTVFSISFEQQYSLQLPSIDYPDFCSKPYDPAPDCIPGKLLLPHPTDCSAYFVCLDNGTTIQQHCPTGQWFNGVISQCITATCAAKKSRSMKCAECKTDLNCEFPGHCYGGYDPSPICSTGDGTTPDPRNCLAFFYCRGGTGFKSKCPEGQWYSAQRRECVKIGGADCREDFGECCACQKVVDCDSCRAESNINVR